MGLRTAEYETRMYGGVRGASHQLQLVGPSTRLDASSICFLESLEYEFLIEHQFQLHFFCTISLLP